MRAAPPPPPGDHSTLEVVPGADYDKQVVPGADYDKEFVPQPAYVAATPAAGYGFNDYQKQHGIIPGETVGEGKKEKRATIFGLKRRTFIIVAWITSLLIAIAIGVGAGLGATMSKNGNSGGSAGAVTTPTGNSVTTAAADISPTRQTSTTPQATQPSDATPASTTSLTANTTPPATLSTTARSSTSSTTKSTSTASVRVGGVGGRCSNQWGGDCICLDKGVCENKWKGTPYTGYEGNWPCPNDPNNIMACVVKPCLGKVVPAQCLWKEACRELSPGPSDSAPICPGEGDFVCCAHSW